MGVRTSIGFVPPSRSDDPVTTLPFDSGYNFVSVNNFDVLVGICGATFYDLIWEPDGGINERRTKSSLLDSFPQMISPNYFHN